MSDATETTDITAVIDRHLEAYGEPDSTRRATLVAEVWSPDGALVDPPLDARGHAGIVEMTATVQAHFPGTFRRTSAVDAHHGVARYEWELVSPEGEVTLTGLDVADIDEHGRLRRVVGFLGPIAAVEA